LAWLSPANASFRLASVFEPFSAGMVDSCPFSVVGVQL
jgi:hypothetical protein